MAPKAAKSTLEELHSDSPSMDASQESNSKFFSNLFREHQKRTAARKAQRKEDILVRHKKRMDSVKGKIANRIEKYNQDMKSMRRLKVQRLMELARKKRELEDELNAGKAELHQACLSVANALRIALEGRVNDLSA